MVGGFIMSRIGEVHTNNEGYKAIITGISDKRSKGGNLVFKLRFLDTNYEFESEYGNLKKGVFKDYNRPTVYGVGYSFRHAKKDSSVCYKTWHHMLERCYDKKRKTYNLYGGNGVRVCDRWLYLKNFIEDIKEIPNYDKYIASPNLYSLDKDILGNGKLYSKETCMFATTLEQSHAQERVKKIKCTTPSGQELIFNSKWEACNYTGVQNANLYKVLKGERKHSLGYKFEEMGVMF
jgi:hypothetical protein